MLRWSRLATGAVARGAEAHLALTGSEHAASISAGLKLRRLWTRLGAQLGGADMLMQRLAGTVFMLRVASAVLAYGSQVLLARWMGSFEFGIYVYVWTWVLLIGQSLDLGLGTAAQRFIPEYRESGALDLLRGFLFGSRLLTLGIATAIASGCAGGVWLLSPWLNDYLVVPLYLACISLPAYGLANTQDGIARSHDWVGLSLMPTYVARQILLTALMAGAYFAGLPMNAVTAMIVAAISIWLPTIGQLLVLNLRLTALIAPGPKALAIRYWVVTSAPILLAEGFYLLLTYADILVLQQFRPPDEVAVYYAAAKTLALVSFIYYAISATTAHRFSVYHVAGDRAGLSAFIAQSIKWTFWPSVAATALLLAVGEPLLRLFGAQFASGYHLMFILAAGLLARAAIGPIERLLNMLGEQRVCALIYGAAFAINFSACLALIPWFGAAGAAIATTTALIVESIMLFRVTKSRLGFHVFIWGRAEQ
jgi:O-antigen/teichoic acid export membrane protein